MPGSPPHERPVGHGERQHGPVTTLRRALLCERHHAKVHSGFRVERQPTGRWRTWRPDGTEITTPAPLTPVAA